jgi:diguanylate cyclase (GGDEF)-like protein
MSNRAGTEAPIQICLVDDSSDDAALLAKTLQDSEPRFRARHIKSKAALGKAIDQGECHVVAGVPLIKRFDAYKAAGVLTELGVDVPVIGISKKGDKTKVVEVMKNGLADLVKFEAPDHLALVIKRELKGKLAVNGGHAQLDFTGLYSRMHFLELLEESLQEENRDSATRGLLYVQLDSFSWINEHIGIASADKFLKAIASVIKANVDDWDYPARYHGGTFVILIHGNKVNDLQEKAQSLANAIANHVFEHGDQVVSSTCSIGLSLVTSMTTRPERLIAHAFDACENAKNTGGNSVNWYAAQTGKPDQQGDPEAWITRIRQAFENDMFTLLFQPIISLQGHKTPRYEALLRMLSDSGDTILPGAFLPFAERAGLMTDIDRWVTTHAISAAKNLLESGIEPEVYLKLSGKALTDKTMAAWIAHAFSEADCPGQVIVFEITESLALTHLAQTRMLIGCLKQLDCKIVLDHFGTSPQSLKALDRLDVDYVKIDGSLIRGLQKDEQKKLQVRKIVDRAKSMNIGTIAESVQDPSSLPTIWQFGVEYIQGYFLQEPDAAMSYDFNQLVL